MAIVVTTSFKPADPLGLYRDRPSPFVAAGTGVDPGQPVQQSYPPLEGNPSNGFNTPLTSSEEKDFKAWKAKYAPGDSGDDYDLRGAFRAGVKPDDKSGHFPDTFKKPNHPTFSDQSQYAPYAPDDAGHWDGDTYVPSPARARAEAEAAATAQTQQSKNQFGALDAKEPGRYALISSSDFDKWQKDWQAKNQSTGLLGDTARLLDAGSAELEQGINEMVGMIPGVGKPLQSLADAFDKVAYGSPSYGGRMQKVIDKDIATLTPESRDARDLPWWDGDHNTLGAAWLNPRSYFTGVVESLPSTVATMLPSMWLARGAYLAKLAAGATEQMAAGAAAKTAMLAGAITEGGLGAAQSSQTVKAQIAAMPRDKLVQTEAVQTLITQGMSEDQAIEAVTNDAATQAFIMGGVATGLFGGFGDRFLAKIIAEGVGGGLAKRIVSGATRGIISEGLLEEAPQGATQQLAQNLALKNTVNPNQDLMEGVADQALGGAAIGAAMGGALGGTAGLARPAAEGNNQAENIPQNITPAPAPRRGPLAAAVDHGLRNSPPGAGAAPLMVDPDSASGPPVAGETKVIPDANPVPLHDVGDGVLPQPGSNVIVEAEGVERFTGRVDKYEEGPDGTEALVLDTATGEYLQVPVSALKTAKLTDQMMAERDRQENPPITREPADTPPDVTRQRHGENLVLPDQNHALLYDFGQQRKVDKGQVRVLGDDALKSNDMYPEERKRLADAFEIPEARVNELADDYRFRVERSAKNGSENGLPLNVHTVDKGVLHRFQLERLRAEKKAAATDETIGLKLDNNGSEIPASETIDEVAHEAATSPLNDLPEPTQPQKEAGNYKMGHFITGGLDISVENPAGSTRSGVDKGGKAWSIEMKHHYGYIKGTVGKDKDHVDVFVKKGTAELGDDAPVFVVDQHNAEGFDEHKVMLGFTTLAQARNAYNANYAKGWKGLGAITPSTMGEFKGWLSDGDTTKPFSKTGSDYADPMQPAASTIAPEVRTPGIEPGNVAQEEPGLGRESAAEVAAKTPHLDADRAAAPAFKAGDRVEWTDTAFDPPRVKAGTVQKPHPALKSVGLVPVLGDGGRGGNGYEVSVPAANLRPATGKIAPPAVTPPKPAAREPAPMVRPSIDELSDYARSVVGSDVRKVTLIGSIAAKGEGHDIDLLYELEPRDLPTDSGDAAEVVEGMVEAVKTPLDAERADSFFKVGDRYFYLAGGAGQALVENTDYAKEQAGKPRKVLAVSDEPVAPPTDDEGKPNRAYGANNKLVTADRAAELRKKLSDKLRNQLSAGIDPEILAMGTELAAFHIEAGARRFGEFAKLVAADLGTTIEKLRPFLRSWYNGARDLMEDSGLDIAGMDTPDEVRTALATLGKADEPAKLEGGSESALAGAPAGEVRVPQAEREAGRGAEPGGGADLFGSDGAGGQRDVAERGVAAGAGEVSDPAGRARSSDSLAKTSVATVAQDRADDFTITDADELGAGGAKTKFRNNVAAVKVLRELEQAKRPARHDEQQVLAKWVGWGGLAAAFPREDGTTPKGWDREAVELKALLTPEEYRAAAASTRNAHYTSREVVDAIWSIVDRLGFAGGRVLEPSVGAGNFIGLMPEQFRDVVQVHGAELDTITGGIAQNLYPKANIQITGFQDLAIPNDYFDLAIGNPPFGSEKLYDAERKALNKFSIHNYFFAKSIETLKPGGVLAMVVTNYFLDASASEARQYIGQRAALIGAIRLPNDAFLKNAGTEVTTDIILLRKLMPGEAPDVASWGSTGMYTGKDGKPVPLSRYFIDHPEMMLGDFGAYGEMYREGTPALISRPGQDLAADLAAAIDTLPINILAAPGAAPEPVVERPAVDVSGALVNSMFLTPEGAVMQRLPNEIGETRAQAVEFPNEKAAERVAGMIRVRDVFTRLRQAQVDPASSAEKLDTLRKRLNTVYDTFTGRHGYFHNDANRRLFRDDPTWPQLAALEDAYDKGISEAVAARSGEQARAPSARKAAIFTKRTQAPYTKPTSAKSAKDALAAVLSDRGFADLAEMSRLYGQPEAEIVRELGGLLYKTHAGVYETADQYLSGNVKKKLEQATDALARDPEMARNIEALREVIPADIEAVDIDVKAGSPWIPPKHIADFIEHVTESAGAKATYARAVGRWIVTVPRTGEAVDAQWGTDRAKVESVLDAALNGKTLTIYDKFDDKSVVNPQATDAANEKVEKVKAEWQRWIWDDDARREELARLYNDIFNTDVIPAYDGAHLQLPGKVSDDVIALRPHQKNYIWRGLQTGTILADHTVGAGKTFAEIALIMEKRRMGQVKKPVLTVPNHLVGQWAQDWIKLYPGANILAATKADFEGPNRRKLFARISTGDWDAVIVAHSSFKYLPVDARFEQKFIEQQIEDMQLSIGELREADGKNSRTVKQMEKAREMLSTRLQKLLDAGGKDDIGMTFEEMGIDGLYVDEAHEFKNLGFATSMQRVAGLGNTTGSQKAADLFMKITSVLERTGGRNVGFLTGTPISNTMAEMFTMQRFLGYASLRDRGIAHFDAWAKVFGEVVTDWELSPSGKYKQNSRFAKFVNMPELMQMYRSFADVITNEDIQRQLAERGEKLPIPKIKGGKPTNITVDRSRDQAAYIGVAAEGTDDYPKGSLVWRAENLPKRAEKGDDNMLKVMSDARKAALDMRLIDPSYGDTGGSKVHRAAAEIYRINAKWSAKRGTQLVFIDLSTPKSAKTKDEARIRELMTKAEAGDEQAQEALDNMSPDEFLALNSAFSVYDDLKAKLIALGIAEREIAFIHDANTDAQKQELFAKVRAGQVRVLFGSTPKMGAGTNVQNRLVALHHLDAPWRPSDLEQRDGRGVRQGNELYAEDPDNFELEILRYATKNTLDARQWQTIEGKARFIAQLRKGDIKDRVVEDVGGEAANAAEMKAAASGNPLILEEIDLKQKIRKLEGAESEHDRAQHRIRFEMRSLKGDSEMFAAKLATMKTDAESAMAFAAEPLKATIGGTDVEKPKELGAAIIAAGRAMMKDSHTRRDLGTLGKFKLSLHYTPSRNLKLETVNTFLIGIDGAQEYGAQISDIDTADATGTAMRVLNTIRDLAHAPANAESRIAENDRQIAGLAKQVGPWTGAADLTALQARHTEVLNALRPKPKAAAPAPVTPPPDAQFSAADQSVATLTGDELGTGHDTPAALRKAALKWYADNLVGEAVKTADGLTVLFNTAGAKETSGSSSSTLLKAVPALRAIIEQGKVTRRDRGSAATGAAADTVGSRLLAVREARGMSRADLASELGLSPQRYGQYERDQRAIPHDVLSRLRKVSGASADFMLFGDSFNMSADLMRAMKKGQPDVSERIVIAAPVSIDGTVHQLAVTIHKTADGRFHYDLMPAAQSPAGAEFADGAGEAPDGWNIFDTSTAEPTMTDAQRDELTEIVRTVSGLSAAQFRERITMPAGNAGWGNDAPRSAAGFYEPTADIIAMAEDSATARTAYHEAFHRLQRLFLTDQERALLRAEAPKLKRIVGSFEFRKDQVGAMSQSELEAEAFAIYASGASTVRPFKAISAAWDRIKAAIERAGNFLRGNGFQIAEDIFDKAKIGDIAARVTVGADGKLDFQTVFHGTKHVFDRFALTAAGTGEGNATYGHGHYFSSSRDVANWYRGQLAADGTPLGGRLVTAQIPNSNNLMDWDKPLAEQPQRVRARLEALGRSIKSPLLTGELHRFAVDRLHKTLADPKATGRAIYAAFGRVAGKGVRVDDAGASALLKGAGIPGHRYVGHESKQVNFVIYDDNQVNMVDSEYSSAGDPTSMPSFKEWFGASKVVDEHGAPLVVYHGTNSGDFEAFSATSGSKPVFGKNSIYFTDSRDDAVGYTGLNADTYHRQFTQPDWDEKARVYEVYLKMEKPADFRDGGGPDFAQPTLDREGTWSAVMRELRKHGYDGVIYDKTFDAMPPFEGTHYVVFDPTQIKSVNNRGSFDGADPRIEYSAADAGPTAADRVRGAGEQVRGKLTDVQPKLLATVPLTYFTELARPNMTAVKEYLRVKRDMDAYRGKKHSAADTIAQSWLKFTRLGWGLLPSTAGKAMAARLASLMHDATLVGADPSKTDLLNTGNAAYPQLRARYEALPRTGQELFGDVRDAYLMQAEELDKLILANVEKAQKLAAKKAEEQYEGELDRIKKSGMTGLELKTAIDNASDRFAKEKIRGQYASKGRVSRLRASFEQSRVPAPYFPLARFGRYTVTVRAENGDVLSFSRREDAAAQNKLARDMKDAFPRASVEKGVMDEAGAGLRQAMDPRIVAEIQSILGDAGADPALMDAIWQRYLQSMPDLSTRKRFIHRKGTAGFDEDALRAFSSHMFHAGHQMARLKYGLDLEEMLDQAAIQARKSDDPTRGTTLVNELALRHKFVMNPTGSGAVQAVTSAMFIWYLGLTPAAALVNLTQTPMLGIPIIGARYGAAKTAAGMLRASRDFIAGKGDAAMSSALNEEERWAMTKFHESGLIDRTRSHDLAGVGNTGVNYSPLRARVMGIMSWAFHNAEIANREVTALTAFRLAKEAGESSMSALDIAHDLTWKTHFDYQNTSRPRLMQSDAAKLLLVFQNYQINMWYRLFRDMHQAFKGETRQARHEARYQLAGMMGMMTLLGGVSGFFGIHILMALAGMFFGDKDDPFGFEEQVKRHIIDLFGPDIGGMILNGVPGQLMHIDLTSRIGMPDFFVRAPDDPNLDGRDWWQQFIIGALGVVPNTIINMGDGFGLLREGKTMKGLELLAPKFMKDVMQAYRFANEGLTTRNSDEILPSDAFGAWQTLAKISGFTPSEVAETYDRNSALKAAEGHVMDERSLLLNQLALAISMKDEEGRDAALERIKAFNANPIHRAVAITADTVKRSLAARARNAVKREDGVLIQNPGLSNALRKLQPERVGG